MNILKYRMALEKKKEPKYGPIYSTIKDTYYKLPEEFRSGIKNKGIKINLTNTSPDTQEEVEKFFTSEEQQNPNLTKPGDPVYQGIYWHRIKNPRIHVPIRNLDKHPHHYGEVLAHELGHVMDFLTRDHYATKNDSTYQNLLNTLRQAQSEEGYHFHNKPVYEHIKRNYQSKNYNTPEIRTAESIADHLGHVLVKAHREGKNWYDAWKEHVNNLMAAGKKETGKALNNIMRTAIRPYFISLHQPTTKNP